MAIQKSFDPGNGPAATEAFYELTRVEADVKEQKMLIQFEGYFNKLYKTDGKPSITSKTVVLEGEDYASVAGQVRALVEQKALASEAFSGGVSVED